MTEYIDRNEAIIHFGFMWGDISPTHAEFVDFLKWCKAEDVQPVRRGQWTEPDNFDLGFWQCSQCGFLSEAAAANRLYNYCPNCGAKMEDVDNE